MNNRQKFFVHVDLGDGEPVVAGYYQLNASRNIGIFFYGRSYCQNPKAFAIDPINLPLVYNQHFLTPLARFNPTGIPGALLDSGPDEWGKRIINRLADPKPMTPADYLVMGSGFGVGAVYFSDSAEPLLPPSSTAKNEILQLYQSAIALDDDVTDLARVAAYLLPSSGIGGARPKAPWLYLGRPCIAKFNRRDDPFDNALAEYSVMNLAAQVGIRCAETHLVDTDLGHVVAVERFDTDQHKRRHMVSANALLDIQDIEQLNHTSYDRIAAVGRQIGHADSIGRELFTRMLFNIAIGNTDDHTRNHAFVKDWRQPSYELSPAYDLVPVPYRIGSHAINLGPFGQSPTLDNITSGGRLMGLDRESQRLCAQTVYGVTVDLHQRLSALGMSEEDLQYLSPCFAQNVKIQALAEA